MASWTLCMSVCTDAHHPLGLANRASLDRQSRVRSNTNRAIAHQAAQRIEAADDARGPRWTSTFDDEPPCPERERVNASAEHLASFVRRTRTRSKDGPLVLWVVGHGHELGARVQQHSTAGQRITARRPFSTIDVADGVSVEGAALGRALEGASVDVLVLQSCAQCTVETLASLFERDAAKFVIASATQVPPPCAAIDAWSDSLPSRADETTVFRAIAEAMRGALAETASGAHGWAAPRGFELALASREGWSSFAQAFERVCSALRETLREDERAALAKWLESGASRASPRGERVTLDDLCTRIRATRPQLAELLHGGMSATFVARERGGDRAAARTATLVATPVIQRTSSEDFCERAGWFNALASLSVPHGVNA